MKLQVKEQNGRRLRFYLKFLFEEKVENFEIWEAKKVTSQFCRH